MALKPEPFSNYVYADFSQTDIQETMKEALDKVSSNFEQEYPMVINGEKITVEQKCHSYNPCAISQNVGTFQKGSADHAEAAIQVASETFKSWSKVPVERRAQYLFDAAQKMREQRYELSAVMVYEVSKSWFEADADVGEAVDFLEFYARSMLRLNEPYADLSPSPGENNSFIYTPMGVAAIIPPWNFPFAILAGMSAAAMVTGNTVVLKPAEESMLSGWQFVRIMEEVGLPKGVLNFITGDGAELGQHMVQHPQTRFINFTGSQEVGLQIIEEAAKRRPGQKWIKRVVAEMGGKNALIVDRDADLDAAAEGIVKSAFGFQGQKCSAGSRVIAHQEIYDQLLDKVASKTLDLKIGNVEERIMYMGAVISQEAEDKILKYIEIGKKEGRLVVGGEKLSEKGHFIAPTVFADIQPEDRMAREEIFGPVTAFIKANDFDHAMEIANGTDYGLTGAIYSNTPEHLQRAEEDFFVGNLYLNRGCTGSLVNVHPFGGFNMSGTDAKAGGPDYLLNFLQAKTITRKIT